VLVLPANLFDYDEGLELLFLVFEKPAVDTAGLNLNTLICYMKKH